jgi:hypothetical protein
MNLRFVAAGICVALLCATAIVLFAPRPDPLIGYARYERGIAALRKHPGAAQEFVTTCAQEAETEFKDKDLEGPSYSSRAEMALDLCRRYFAVAIDGRLTLAEINRPSLPLSVLEEAERREPRFP